MADNNQPTSAAAIVGLVLGILAIVTSWVPVVINPSRILAMVGLVFSIVGVVGTVRGTKGGKGLAVAALVLNVLSLVIVLGLQSAWSAALS